MQIVLGEIHGREIRAEREFVDLTALWRASGAADMKRPGRWRETEAAREFIGYIETTETIANGDSFRTVEGRTGGTWAHWQIALAYAKYLSPEFHAQANRLIRDAMSGREAAAAAPARRARVADLTSTVNAGVRLHHVQPLPVGQRLALQDSLTELLVLMGHPPAPAPDPQRTLFPTEGEPREISVRMEPAHRVNGVTG